MLSVTITCVGNCTGNQHIVWYSEALDMAYISDLSSILDLASISTTGFKLSKGNLLLFQPSLYLD